MGDTSVEIGERELESIGRYVQSKLGDWLQSVPAFQVAVSGKETMGRLIHLEEELKQQRVLMEERFDAVNKRFEQVDRRFEQVDKRFDDLIHMMDKRFESVDKRFEQVDRRFEQVDKRFDDLIHMMDKRFESVDKRFASVQWLIATGFVLLSVLMSVYQFL